MTPTPATAERLARALADLLSPEMTRMREQWPEVIAARAALAAYTAEGGKL